MTIQNDFLPFATVNGANVVDQATYAGASYVSIGRQSGILPSNIYNKIARQSSIAAYLIGNLINNEANQNALDDGNLGTLYTNFLAALKTTAAAGFHPPQVTVSTTGSGTYTTPTIGGVLPISLEIEMSGGGSGGNGSGAAAGVGAAGGDTTFGTLTAHGGPATPVNTVTAYPTAATATGGDTNVPGGLGGAPNIINGTNAGMGGQGASHPLGSGGAGATSNAAATSIPAAPAEGFGAGGGGGGLGSAGTYDSGWGGNAGAYLKAIISTPAATYSYAVGAAGTGGAAGSLGTVGSAGSGGIIRIIARWQ